MKRKVVENWLTNVKELTFTVPFCQLLLAQGYEIVHISSQGPLEQGKDIIARDREGTIHCYQLKCGKITNDVWGKIKSEIDDLTELPPVHPSLPEPVDKWKCYLVTNGNLANPVARTISDYSGIQQRRGHQALETVVQGQLVDVFTEHFGDFLPEEIDDLQRFLDIYNQNGDFTLNPGVWKQYFEAFFVGKAEVSDQKKGEAIRASLILCNYLLTYKQANGNHIEVVKAYALLLTSIYFFVEKHALTETVWRKTESLIFESIELEYKQLIDELSESEGNRVQAKYGFLSEVITNRIRNVELIGYLAAYSNYAHLVGKPVYKSEVIDRIAETAKQSRIVYGESYIPLLVNEIGRLHFSKKHSLALAELSDLMRVVLSTHRDNHPGLPGPYFSITEAAEISLGLNESIRETFRRKSFAIRALLLLLVRWNQREFIAKFWRLVSYICQREAIPTTKEDYLLWRFEEGRHSDLFPDATQSWASLVRDSSIDYSLDLPKLLRKRIHFLPFLINVMPHRANHKFILPIFDETH